MSLLQAHMDAPILRAHRELIPRDDRRVGRDHMIRSSPPASYKLSETKEDASDGTLAGRNEEDARERSSLNVQPDTIVAKQRQTPPTAHHPYLRPATLPVYKGRALKEDTSSGEVRYIDEAAIFVGRLVKTIETKETLLRRFERYGKIVSPSPNPEA